MREALSKNPSNNHGYEVRGEQLWFKGRLVLPQNSRFKNALLWEFHDTPIRGHSRIFRTYKRVATSFYWVCMKKDIQDYVQRCDVCQRNKHDSLTPAELLQPLPILDRVWENMFMDFIEGLPSLNGFSVILVVVDRLSKYGHFIALKHPYIAKGVAEIFLKEVVRLYGMPRSIVSDRDPIFTSQFWSEFFQLQGSELRMSSAYHPQTDGQTEVLNRCLKTYLCCFVNSKQKQWLQWLPWAEYWYNTNYHTTTCILILRWFTVELQPPFITTNMALQRLHRWRYH